MAELQDPSQAPKEEHPLLASRPPVTDPITYLTIIEYNLSEETLPVLHKVLQDSELTATIGWDLVHLLLPLLPASEECLQDIATKGNPRECVLKVTEALRLLEFQERQGETDEEEDDAEESEHTLKIPEVGLGESSTSPAFQRTILPPLPVLKFEILLDVLATLHRRVKTKYPSRFLSTSLQAVLVAYNRANTHIEELTLSAIKFVKTLSGTKRPHLPSRRSSGNLLRTGTGQSEPDPEAQSEAPGSEETKLVNRLLQSFLTHILEDYVLSLTSDDDVPGLSWASRLIEKYQPQRVPNKPNYQKYADRFAKDEDLTSRTAILGQVVALVQDLGLDYDELLQTVTDAEIETRGVPGTEDEPPATAEDIPLSRTGSLILIAARHVKQELYASAKTDESSSIAIFPDHATILSNFVGTLGPQTVGLEPEALLDTILALGLVALEKNNVGEPKDDEAFAQYLQTISLISANTPSPSLRGLAHYLTSTVLRSHPHDLVRLTFIRDTLEHCPYENLKASAVSWLKGETLEANAPGHQAEDGGETNIFATSVAISTVAPFLWPDLADQYKLADVADSWIQFRQELGFYVAALNFYYLLLQAEYLHDTLGVKNLQIEHYIKPLKGATAQFKQALDKGADNELGLDGEEALEQAKADVGLLEKVIEWVEGGLKKL
ncbi:YAP-binding/ALF4/Glomulin [Pyrenochaeta sp. MPI-SDFR-AT-0127]|nr:YAP-binding/ALF4/Glomulin [Pyrenochaeta sp. MPI-SDFR-AT-0127]